MKIYSNPFKWIFKRKAKNIQIGEVFREKLEGDENFRDVFKIDWFF